PVPGWIALDEPARLQRLPHLATLIVESRTNDVRLVLGVHVRSPLEARYGAEAEVLLSTPRTKIFLRTREPRTADWISRAIDEAGAEPRHGHETSHVPPLTGTLHGAATRMVGPAPASL